MKLSESKRQEIKHLLEDESSSGMILWPEEHDDGDTTANGLAQGNPIEVVMMTLQAVDFAARSLDMTPRQVLKKLAELISEIDRKPGKIRSNPRKNPRKFK